MIGAEEAVPTADEVGNAIYNRMCNGEVKCANGVDYYGVGVSSEEIANFGSETLETLRTDDNQYHTIGTKSLVKSVTENAKHPLIIVLNAGTNQLVPMDYDAMSNGKGSGGVLFLDSRITVLSKNARGETVTVSFADVVLHELYHANKMLRGDFDSTQSSVQRYGTTNQWEINAVTWSNAARKTWERTTYKRVLE